MLAHASEINIIKVFYHQTMAPELYKIRETKYNQRENTLSSEYRDREKIREITRIKRSARTTDSELPKAKSDKARE